MTTSRSHRREQRTQPHASFGNITVTLEEYRQLYALVLFRLNALDQRIPLAAAALTSLVGAVTVVPSLVQHLLLVGLPLSSLWLFLTTVNHARSLEDAFRRIEEIERHTSRGHAPSPMSFQSTHPSRGVFVGGRTGDLSVRATAFNCLLITVACAVMAALVVSVPVSATGVYALLLIAIVLTCGAV